MKKVPAARFTGVLLLILSAALVAAAAQLPCKDVQSSLDSWLALIDAGKSDESWEKTAESFRAVVTKEQWRQSVKTVREPLGKTIKREVTRATYTREIGNAPKGHYVIVQLEGSFEHKPASVETVTLRLGPDGAWRVSGYFVK